MSKQKTPLAGGAGKDYLKAFNRLYSTPVHTSRKRLPPYGKQLLNHRKSGEWVPGDVIILIGSEAWQQASDLRQQYWKAPLVAPEDAPPAAFSWPVQGLPVLVFQFGDIEEMEVIRLAHVLLKQGATVVRYLGLDGLTVFGGRNQHG